MPSRSTAEVPRTGTALLPGAQEPSKPLVAPLPVSDAERGGRDGIAYVDAMPIGYESGGGGVLVAGSVPLTAGLHLFGRYASAVRYRELHLGIGYRWQPRRAGRLSVTVAGGVERGELTFDSPGLGETLSDDGAHVGATAHLRLSPRSAVRLGVGYDTLFGGDAVVLGGSAHRVNGRVDIVSRIELGDDDSLGIGVRYHY